MGTQQPHAFAFALNRRREMMATTMTTMRMAPARRSPAGVVQRRNPTKAMLVRPYTVRKGEVIEDIIEKRGIKIEEVEALKEGVDLSSLKAYQVIKLPRNKYTEREKEMLVGAARVPVAFFSMGSGMSFGKLALVVLVAGVAGVAAWKSRED